MSSHITELWSEVHSAVTHAPAFGTWPALLLIVAGIYIYRLKPTAKTRKKKA